jgi:hypothetical protein
MTDSKRRNAIGDLHKPLKSGQKASILIENTPPSSPSLLLSFWKVKKRKA